MDNSVLSLVAGSFADAVARIWSDRRIGEYLAAADARRHLWHACLAAESGMFRPTDPDAAEVSYARFTNWKGRYLVAQAYGVQPPGLLGVLGRLGAEARSSGVYRALVEAMAVEDAGSDFLSRCRQPRDALIMAVAALPAHLRLKRLMQELNGLQFAPEEAAFFAWSVSRLTALQGPGAAAAVLASRRPIQAMQNAHEALPFPNPPWPGSDLLRPVTSPERLKAIASSFENCLAHSPAQAILEARIGLKCFYEWRGDEPALLEFRACPPLGWRLTEAKGANNAPVSVPTRAKILAALVQCPTFAPVWPTDEEELLAGL